MIIKPTTISKEQQILLFEMIRYYIKNYSYKTKLTYTGNILFGNGFDNKFTTRIHWYEFIMTYLSEYIFFKPPIKRDSMLKYIEFTRICNLYFKPNLDKIEEYHPINLLYKEFNNIKNT